MADSNLADLPERGNGGVGIEASEHEKQLHSQPKQYRDTKVVNTPKPTLIRANVSLASLIVQGSIAASDLLDALATSAPSLVISPSLLFLPLLLLSGDTPIRLAQRGKFKGKKQNSRDQDFDLPPGCIDWWHNGGGKAGNMGKDIGKEPADIGPKDVLDQWEG